MNWLHRRLCASRLWRRWLERDLLPWTLAGLALDGDVLEIGPGPGAATGTLLARAARLICVELDSRLARRLAGRVGGAARVLCADAGSLPLASASVDAVLCLMVLHHVSPPARQDRVLAEAARVLRPGGSFALLESRQGAVLRWMHARDTLEIVDPRSLAPRLARAGFAGIEIDVRPRTFRVRATVAIDRSC